MVIGVEMVMVRLRESDLRWTCEISAVIVINLDVGFRGGVIS